MAAPVLLLCVGRPELLTARPAWARGAVLRPGPLDEVASRRAAGAGPPLPAAALEGVVARARGNPLFLEQLAAHVRERSEAGTLPPALHALLAARLDTLGATERRVIEAGAIEGETFHVGGLEALVPDPGRAGLDAALELLSQRELVRPAFPFIAGQRAFRFGHALVRDAAYAAMPLAARAEAHERLAGWLADLGVAVPEASARIGTQLERAWRAASELRLPTERLEDLAHKRRHGSPRPRTTCTGAATCLGDRIPGARAGAPGAGRRRPRRAAAGHGRRVVRGRQPGTSGRGGRRGGRRVPIAIVCACAARSSASACAPTGTPSRSTPPPRWSWRRTPPWRSRRSATTSASRVRAT